MSKINSKINIGIPEDEPVPFAIISAHPWPFGETTYRSPANLQTHGKEVRHTFYLSNLEHVIQEPKAKIALVFMEEGCITIETDDNDKHVGVLSEWHSKDMAMGREANITHKFTCLDDFAPEGHSVFMRAAFSEVTRAGSVILDHLKSRGKS